LTPQELSDIEELHQLKARYLRFGDTHQMEEFKKLFTADVSVSYTGVPRSGPNAPSIWEFQGRDELIQGIVKAMSALGTVEQAHQAYLPEITITGPTTAKGIWAVHDYLVMSHCIFKGWGHYHEEYKKVDGKWVISKLRLTRIRIEETWR
jgi:hypothetical protein